MTIRYKSPPSSQKSHMHDLLEAKLSSSLKRPSLPEGGLQLRERVQKEIFTPKGAFRLSAKRSMLSLHEDKGHFGAIETLEEIEGAFQEEIHPNTFSQQVRTFFAPSGVYEYPTHRFFSEEILLHFYQLEGTLLPFQIDQDPYLSAIGENVFFCFSEKTPFFQAKALSATVDPIRYRKEAP